MTQDNQHTDEMRDEIRELMVVDLPTGGIAVPTDKTVDLVIDTIATHYQDALREIRDNLVKCQHSSFHDNRYKFVESALATINALLPPTAKE